MIARIRHYFARLGAQREWNRKLEDDRRVREAMIGRPYAKRRASQLNAQSRRTYADGIDAWFAREAGK
jgi:hypothetical protein